MRWACRSGNSRGVFRQVVPRAATRSRGTRSRLEPGGSRAVQRLSVREPFELQLPDQATAGEPLHLQVLLGLRNGLLHPIRAGMAGPLRRVASGVPLELQLPDQALEGERLKFQASLGSAHGIRSYVIQPRLATHSSAREGPTCPPSRAAYA